MVKGTGKRAKTTDRHIITLSPEFSEQLDEALEIARLRTVLKPVEATLGNPVAFPLIFGGLGVVGGLIALKLLFPDPIAQAKSEVEKAAENIARVFWEITHGIGGTEVPGTEGKDVAEVANTFIDNLRELLMRLWNDPLFGFGGGGGPIIPNI